MIKFLIAFIPFWAIYSEAAANISVSPLVIERDLQSAQGLFTVRNLNSRENPVEIVATKRVTNEKGEVETIPADEDFLIFPPQVVLPPGGVQNFRFQWLGEQRFESNSYYLNVRELPLALDDAGEEPQGFGGTLSLYYQYSIGVHLFPQSSEAEYSLTNATSTRGPNGEPAISFSVKNDGTRYGRVGDFGLRVTVDGETNIEFDADFISENLSDPVILPGQNATLTFGLAEEIPPGSVLEAEIFE